MRTNNRRMTLEEFPGYVIEENGNIYSNYSSRYLKHSIGNSGYPQTRLKRKSGETLTIGIHRLLCLCFKPPQSDPKGLYVNHLDGDKSNYSLVNLEWSTPLENVEHAGREGLTDKCKPVSLVRLDTWEVVNYPSIIKCARALGLSKDAVSYRVNCVPGKFPDEPFVILYQSKLEDFLKKVNKENPDIDHNGINKPVSVRNLLTGEIKNFPKITDLASHLKIPLSTASSWLRIKGQPVLPGLLQFKLKNDKEPWRHVDDPYLELIKVFKRKVIFVKGLKGDTRIFTSGIECAKEMGITPTALSYRLKSDGKVVFSDGYLYAYYEVAKQNCLIE